MSSPDRPVLLAELPVAAVVVDSEGVIEAANDAATTISGWGSDLVGMVLATVMDDGPGPRVEDGGPRRASLRRPDGSQASVLAAGMRVVVWHPGEEVSGMDVVSTVSHELRSPLTSVKGFTSLLLNRWDRIDDDQKRSMLQQVHDDADRVTRLVGELLDISRLETGRLVLRRQMVDLAVVAQSVVTKLAFDHDGLDCRLDFAPGVPEVYADPDKVEQVLTNLVENAAKYASPIGLAISGEATEGFVAVAVHDQGEGIPEEDLPLVFTKFFRRDVGRPSGSGLGLWISRGLVEAHGGELTAASNAGRGSVFRFTLPTEAFPSGENP